MNKLKAVFKEGTPWKYLILSVVLYGLAGGIFKGGLDNYLAEIVQMGEFDRGVAEFFRELPGLMLVLILAMFYTLSAEAFYKIGALVMLLGMGMLAIVPPTKILVTMAICLHSLGDHLQMGMRSTLTMGYSKDGRDGEALGRQNALMEIGMLVGYVIIIVAFSLADGGQPFRLFFLISALILGCSFASTLKLAGSSETDKSKSRFYFRRKFAKYYILECFYGARKQVFLTFGPYVLILFYGASVTTVSILFAITSITSFLLSPAIGRLIDKVGYRIIMIADTLLLFIVCFFYGFAHHFFSMDTAFLVCCTMYVFDSIISRASMAASVYVKDIASSPFEVKATLATGMSVNHGITILIALFGGWIWSTLGIETLFMISAALGLANSAFAATIKKPKNK